MQMFIENWISSTGPVKVLGANEKLYERNKYSVCGISDPNKQSRGLILGHHVLH